MKINTRNVHYYINHMKTLAYLGNVEAWDAEELYIKLRRIELKMNRQMCDECNGTSQLSGEQEESLSEKTLAKLAVLLPLATGLFLNGDPRGYTLKIKEDNVKALNENGKINIYQDWGGYGILAPEF